MLVREVLELRRIYLYENRVHYSVRMTVINTHLADLSVRNLAILCKSGEFVHVVQEHLRDAFIRQRRSVRIFKCCTEGVYNGRGAHGRR